MTDDFLPDGLAGPDFYVAAIGRSGSTMLCNWLSRPPEQLVFNEPFFRRATNPRLLRIQLADFGMAASDAEWCEADASGRDRFRRLMAHRLEGRRWAFKEVLCEEHFAVLGAFRPPRVVITVRDIGDVALSFFEKHRLQDNLDRFDDRWVVDYCLRESSGILEFREILIQRGVPHHVARYEDFAGSEQKRQEIANFVGWRGGGDTAAHLAEFDRAFEVERHGRGISAPLSAGERRLNDKERELARTISERCGKYQALFGYR
jgi:hypothetical protein